MEFMCTAGVKTHPNGLNLEMSRLLSSTWETSSGGT